MTLLSSSPLSSPFSRSYSPFPTETWQAHALVLGALLCDKGHELKYVLVSFFLYPFSDLFFFQTGHLIEIWPTIPSVLRETRTVCLSIRSIFVSPSHSVYARSRRPRDGRLPRGPPFKGLGVWYCAGPSSVNMVTTGRLALDRRPPPLSCA
jgi:hypothetical protein